MLPLMFWDFSGTPSAQPNLSHLRSGALMQQVFSNLLLSGIPRKMTIGDRWVKNTVMVHMRNKSKNFLEISTHDNYSGFFRRIRVKSK